MRFFVRAGGGGHAPFFAVLGTVVQGFVEAILTSTLRGGACNISESSDF